MLRNRRIKKDPLIDDLKVDTSEYIKEIVPIISVAPEIINDNMTPPEQTHIHPINGFLLMGLISMINLCKLVIYGIITSFVKLTEYIKYFMLLNALIVFKIIYNIYTGIMVVLNEIGSILNNVYNFTVDMLIVCKKIAYKFLQVSALYLFWVVVHYFAAHLYVEYCTPDSVVGLIISPLLSPAPHCKMLRWAIATGGNTIDMMWVVVGTWVASKIIINNVIPVNQ